MNAERTKKFYAVFDIGKTNIKLSLLNSETGALVLSAQSENRVKPEGEYPSADVDYIWAWLKAQLKDMAGSHHIKSLGITTHGATVACVGEDGLTLPVLDYEFAGIDEIKNEYANARPPFAETYSPDLPCGLNLGAQLFWLQNKFPEAFRRTKHLLMYPQYWGYRLSGRAVSEVTSLGCHTDLWNPVAKDFSPLVTSQKWRDLFPPLLASGESLGCIHSELADELGLPRDCEIINGIHDSNASLVPHLLKQQAPFAVISSGTWTIIAGIGSSTNCLDESKDMLANVNAFGDATACIRFMGGREWQVLSGKKIAEEADFLSIFQRKIYAIPAFSNQGGPFRHFEGRVVGASNSDLNESEKTALATLYLALMTDHCLSLLEQSSAVIVEGSFAGNPWLLKILASLRSSQSILFSKDATGTTGGTACLFDKKQAREWEYELFSVDASSSVINSFIQSYRENWHSLLSR